MPPHLRFLALPPSFRKMKIQPFVPRLLTDAQRHLQQIWQAFIAVLTEFLYAMEFVTIMNRRAERKLCHQ
jgi:hypothetical protein